MIAGLHHTFIMESQYKKAFSLLNIHAATTATWMLKPWLENRLHFILNSANISDETIVQQNRNGALADIWWVLSFWPEVQRD